MDIVKMEDLERLSQSSLSIKFIWQNIFNIYEYIIEQKYHLNGFNECYDKDYKMNSFVRFNLIVAQLPT